MKNNSNFILYAIKWSERSASLYQSHIIKQKTLNYVYNIYARCHVFCCLSPGLLQYYYMLYYYHIHLYTFQIQTGLWESNNNIFMMCPTVMYNRLLKIKQVYFPSEHSPVRLHKTVNPYCNSGWIWATIQNLYYVSKLFVGQI